MRKLLCLFLLLSTNAFAQKPGDTAALQIQSALTGEWVGVLEYRDYSEPPTSTKRVQLPTWLSIKPAAEGTRFAYIYDDGPTKTVTSQDVVVIDTSDKTYKVIDTDHVSESYKISGIEKLREGHGELILLGTGKDNDKPAEIRITLTIRRNLLTWLEEVRPAGATGDFIFRHRYTFTRSQPPPAKP